MTDYLYNHPEFGKLNEQAHFYIPFQITEDGSYADSHESPYVDDIYFEEGSIWRLEELPKGWWPVNGFSSQDGYSGPLMHASEQLAGEMEAWVRANPGHYVLINPNIYLEDEVDTEQSNSWVLLQKEKRMINKYSATVTINCSSLEEAEQVLGERLLYDEDYGFEYQINYELHTD